MSLRKTSILAAIVLATILYIIKVDIPRDAEKAKEGMIFKDIKKDQISSIEIIKPSSSFTLVNSSPRSDSRGSEEQEDSFSTDIFKDWQLKEIPGSKLDPAAVGSLVSSLLQLKLDSPLPADELDKDLSVYGLSSPALRIKIDTASGNREMLFGKLNSYLNQRYLKFADSDEVYLAPEYIFSSAGKDRDEFRDRTPIEFVDHDLSTLIVRSPRGRVALQPGEHGDWNIQEPIKAPADQQAVAEVSRTLRNLRAERFIDDLSQKNKYKLDKPELVVQLKFKETAKRSDLLVNISTLKDDKGEKSYAYIDGMPSIYELSVNPSNSLTKTADQLRERKLFSFAADAVKSLTIERLGQEPLKISKNGEQWSVGQAAGDKAFINQLLNDLNSLEAKDFPSGPHSEAFTQPVLKVTVDEGEGAEGKVLTVGDLVGKNSQLRYASISGVPFIIAIAEDSLKKIAPNKETLLAASTSKAADEEGSHSLEATPQP